MIRRVLQPVLGVVVMLAGLVVATSPAQAGPATQAACPSPSHNNNGEGHGVMLGTYNLKVGPYAACDNVRSVATGTVVYLWCWVRNSHGNYWWWVRVQGTSTHGWMSEDNMTLHFYDENNDGYIDIYRC